MKRRKHASPLIRPLSPKAGMGCDNASALKVRSILSNSEHYPLSLWDPKGARAATLNPLFAAVYWAIVGSFRRLSPRCQNFRFLGQGITSSDSLAFAGMGF